MQTTSSPWQGNEGLATPKQEDENFVSSVRIYTEIRGTIDQKMTSRNFKTNSGRSASTAKGPTLRVDLRRLWDSPPKKRGVRRRIATLGWFDKTTALGVGKKGGDYSRMKSRLKARSALINRTWVGLCSSLSLSLSLLPPHSRLSPDRLLVGREWST